MRIALHDADKENFSRKGKGFGYIMAIGDIYLIFREFVRCAEYYPCAISVHTLLYKSLYLLKLLFLGQKL